MTSEHLIHLRQRRGVADIEKEEDPFSVCFNEVMSCSTETQTTTNGRQSKPTKKTLTNQAQLELDKYLQLPVIQRKDDPLEWWKSNKDNFPLMQAAAKKHLGTPSSSVFSERMFSEAGTIFDDRRSRLLPNRGEKLLFLHHNANKRF